MPLSKRPCVKTFPGAAAPKPTSSSTTRPSGPVGEAAREIATSGSSHCIVSRKQIMEVRLDPITNEPILLATKRAQRPHFGAGKPVHPPVDTKRPRVAKKIDPF